MQIFRFDPEVSLPISQFGSTFSIGQLTGPDANVRVQIMHLPSGGLVGRHPAVTRQLFAVVAGSGWVSGQEGHHRAIDAGQAALWEVGEEHECGSDAGLTAVCIEGTFDLWAFKVTQDIVVREYDPAWPAAFETVRANVWPAIEEIALRIDHVGSTAVPGIAAKPIIDMDIVVQSVSEIEPVIERLRGIGYRWRGEMGVEGRHAFAKLGENTLPAHHLYLVVENNKAHLDHWLLRDLLCEDAVARERYGALKKQNAIDVEGDIDRYVAAKAALVAELLTRARAERGFPPATYWEPEIGAAPR